MLSIRRILAAILALASFEKHITVIDGARSVERHIQIINSSGHRVEIFWVHPQTSELVKQTDPHVHDGATFELNSFVGHTFQVIELASSKTGACIENECKTNYFTVSENDDQVFYLNEGLEIDEEDNVSIARNEATDMIQVCRDKALASVSTDRETSIENINELVKCVESSVAVKLENANEEIAFQASVRTKMGSLLENYTCADEELPTTTPIETKTWLHNDRDAYSVDIMHERSRSKIHLIDNFIRPEECEAMEKAAKPTLHVATVADHDGGSRVSESRKAMQAGIKVPWAKEKYGNPIAVLSRRVFDYTNSVTDFELEEFGQEDLMSIQYFGRGIDDETPDRYTPHCDGECTGRPHKHGTRVATMVMYCDVPEVGGATNFRNAGIHIVPKAGNAVFFSYMADGTMDNGFTEHSGCPVLVGEKKIVTQWMRKGVDKYNTWDQWNTLGVKISETRD